MNYGMGPSLSRGASFASVPSLPQARVDPLRLDPDYILRTVVYVQAAFRRFLVEDLRVLAGIRSTTPAPPVAVSLWACRRLLRPERIDREGEGMAVAVLICGRERGLTLGPIVAAYDEYAPHLPTDHPVLELLRERFFEVETQAEEDLLKRLRRVSWPSEGRAVLAEVKSYWGAPATPPGGGEELFKACEDMMEKFRQHSDNKLTALIPQCRTMAGLDALDEAILREFEDRPTKLKGRSRFARVSYREYLESMAQTTFGWPPTGNIPPLSSLARWLAHELGEDHIIVQDFVAAVRRLRKKTEEEAVARLAAHLDALTKMRRKLNAVPSPPRLLAEGYQEEIRDLLMAAEPALHQTRQEMGTESPQLLMLERGILLPDRFVPKLIDECEEAAAILRKPQPSALPGTSTEEGEEQLAAAVRLAQLLEFLKAEDAVLYNNFETEFEGVLESARLWVNLFDGTRARSQDEAPQFEETEWHRPPGFETFEQPIKIPSPPPTPPRPATPPEPEPEEPKPDVKVRLKIHGITLEETLKFSDILVRERVAQVIAKECGIPQEWVSRVVLVKPGGRDPQDGPATAPEVAEQLCDGSILEDCPATEVEGTLTEDPMGVPLSPVF